MRLAEGCREGKLGRETMRLIRKEYLRKTTAGLSLCEGERTLEEVPFIRSLRVWATTRRKSGGIYRKTGHGMASVF